MTPTASQVLVEARKWLGYKEGPNNRTTFGKWYGLDHNPWCGMWVSYVAAQAKATDIIPRYAYTPSGEAWFVQRKQWGRVPKVGAIGFLHTPGYRNGLAHHTFFVEAVHSNGTFTTIEGNTNTSGSSQGDGVYRLQRAASSRITFGYPAYRTAPHVNLKRVTRAANGGNKMAAAAGVLRIQRALAAEGLLGGFIPGRYGGATKTAYAKWQRTKPGGGYRGHDADGLPGRDSLRRLGRRHNFTVT